MGNTGKERGSGAKSMLSAGEMKENQGNYGFFGSGFFAVSAGKVAKPRGN